jgi:hypothetical protein
MFTIRYIDNGREEIWRTERVVCNHPPGTVSGLTELWCSFNDIQGDSMPIRTGEVYVMNDGGKTVASYNLNHQVAAAQRYDAQMHDPAPMQAA